MDRRMVDDRAADHRVSVDGQSLADAHNGGHIAEAGRMLQRVVVHQEDADIRGLANLRGAHAYRLEHRLHVGR